MENIQSLILDLLSKGELGEAIDKLLSLTKEYSPKHYSDIVYFSFQYNRIKSAISKDIISWSERFIRESKIVIGLIDIIIKIEESLHRKTKPP